MNKLKMSEIDKAIISQCGKSARERYETSGTGLKKIVVKWLIDNNYDVENLKNRLILLKKEGKEILCVISSRTEDKKGERYVVGIASANKYSKDNEINNSWVVLFAMINGEDVNIRIKKKKEVEDIAKFTKSEDRKNGYYACSYNDVKENSEEFETWFAKMNKEENTSV